MNAATSTGRRREDRAGPLWPTLVACLIVSLTFGTAVAVQTDGMEHWTFESKRIADAEAGRLEARSTVLRDSEGQTWTAFQGEAQVYLVDFVYTRCVTICQALGSEFTQMQEQLRSSGEGRVRLLSISIDPAHDDARALASFGRLHRADTRHWSLSAPLESGEEIALRRQLGVIVIPDDMGGFIHNGDIHLLDGHGRLLAIYDYTKWRTALDVAKRVAAVGRAS